MSDRELLGLAAKAAGLTLEWQEGWNGMADLASSIGRVWNPLADDGDALRLAVRLQLDIEFVHGDTLVLNVSEGGGDPDERARRAIVRAAAEIGKAMP